MGEPGSSWAQYTVPWSSPIRVHILCGISIGSSVLAQLTVVTNTQITLLELTASMRRVHACNAA